MDRSPAKGESISRPKRAIQSRSLIPTLEHTSSKKKQREALVEVYQRKLAPSTHARQDQAPRKTLEGSELQVRRESIRPTLSAPAAVARAVSRAPLAPAPPPPPPRRTSSARAPPSAMARATSNLSLAAPRREKPDARARTPRLPECTHARKFFFNESLYDTKENNTNKFINKNRKEVKQITPFSFVSSYPCFGTHDIKSEEKKLNNKQKASMKRENTQVVPHIDTLTQMLSKEILKKEIRKSSSSDTGHPKSPLRKTSISQQRAIYQPSSIPTEEIGQKGDIGIGLPKASRSKTFITEKWPIQSPSAASNENFGKEGTSRVAAFSKPLRSKTFITHHWPIRMSGGASNEKLGGEGSTRVNAFHKALLRRISIAQENPFLIFDVASNKDSPSLSKTSLSENSTTQRDTIGILDDTTEDDATKGSSRFISFSNTSLHDTSIAHGSILLPDMVSAENIVREKTFKTIDHYKAPLPEASNVLERLSRVAGSLPVESAAGENSYWNIGLSKAKLNKTSSTTQEGPYRLPGFLPTVNAMAAHSYEDTSRIQTRLSSTTESDSICQMEILPLNISEGENSYNDIGVPKTKLPTMSTAEDEPIIQTDTAPTAVVRGRSKDGSFKDPVAPILLREKPLDLKNILEWKGGSSTKAEARSPRSIMEYMGKNYPTSRRLKVM